MLDSLKHYNAQNKDLTHMIRLLDQINYRINTEEKLMILGNLVGKTNEASLHIARIERTTLVFAGALQIIASADPF